MQLKGGRCGLKAWISPDPRALLAALVLLAGCGEEERRVAPDLERKQPAVANPAPPPQQPVEEPAPASAAAGKGATELVKAYYALIEARKFRDAYRLREPAKGAASEAEFTANFERYAEHRATVGSASKIVEAGNWLYVEVPVQMYGRMKSGAPFGTAGTLTLRRRKAEPNADWRIYTNR